MDSMRKPIAQVALYSLSGRSGPFFPDSNTFQDIDYFIYSMLNFYVMPHVIIF